jgi:adenylate cyclase
LPDDVRLVLAAADLAAEQTAARVRLAALILIGLLLAALGSLSGVYRVHLAVIFALNAGLSVAAIVLARPGIFRSWVPWALATLDAAVVVGIMIYGDLNARRLTSYTPALVVSWVIFVLLGLTTMRFKPALVLYLGGLFVCGMAGVIGFQAAQAAPLPTDPLGANLARLFDPQHDLVRLLLIALTACVLALTVGRARGILVKAVIAARRSANLSRYFAAGLVPLLADAEVEVLKRGRRQRAAILFADIRGFTAMSEQLEPAAIAEFLGAFRLRATRAIERHGGIVD